MARRFLFAIASILSAFWGARELSAGVAVYEARNRDKSGTSAEPFAEVPLQVQASQAVRNSVYFPAEGTGFESGEDFEVSENGCYLYVNCQEGCAAQALHPAFIESLELALNGADLQLVIDAWSGLQDAVRKAILKMIG